MKRIIVLSFLMGGLFFLATKNANAGMPTSQILTSRSHQVVPANSTSAPSREDYTPTMNWNTLIAGSTLAASATAGSIVFPVVQATMTFNGGVSNSTFSARNCLTDLTVSLSNASTFYLLDGGTTDYVILGGAALNFSGSTASVWTKHWDASAPFCGTAGNTLTLSIPAPSANTVVNSISADGFTVLTGLSSVYNIGQ